MSANEPFLGDTGEEANAVLFVCLGNICRSPLAEAAFRRAAGAAGLDIRIDSAGTGDWHIGHPPDPRTIAMAAAQGIDIGHYRARQIEMQDFERFTHIFALDATNLGNLRSLAPSGSRARIKLLMDAVEGRRGQAVPDPYTGGEHDFRQVWKMVVEATEALVASFQEADIATAVDEGGHQQQN